MSNWSNQSLARITVKDALSPGDTFSFDGMAAISYDLFQGNLQPNRAYYAIQTILDIGGLSALPTDMVKTVKQSGDGSGGIV